MKYITPQLETERLILKRGTYEDYVKVYEYDFTKLRDIAGEFEYVKQDPEVLIGFDTYADEEDNVYDWIMYLKENDMPIGNIVADREIEELKSTELAFNLHPNYWGKGYMKEAVVEVMKYLFENGFENVMCGYDEGNIKSEKVGEKIGFVPYSKKENAWVKNGVGITSYKTILSKERFNELYNSKTK